MTNNEIKTTLMSIRNLKNEEIVNRRLGTVDLKSDEQNDNEIKVGIVKWLRAKFPSLSKDEILNIINQKGGFSALAGPYLVTEIQKEIDEQEKQQAAEQVAIQQKEAEEFADEQRQDEEHNDLFELTLNNGNFRLQDKDALLRDMQDRQRNVFDRNLKLLEALEEIRKVSRQRDGVLEIDLSHMKELDPKVFEMQKDLLSRFKIKAMTVGREGQDRDAPEREIALETVTREQLEQGEVTLAIPFKTLQSLEWEKLSEKFRNQMKGYLEQKGIEVEEKEPLSIEDDVLNAIAGKDRTAKQGPTKEDDGAR